MATQTTDQPERRRRARRGALLLALVALAFYAGFIAMGVLNS